MHQDIVPLCAADIQEQLKKRFAYLSGEFRKPGVRGTARVWPVMGLHPALHALHQGFAALCNVPDHGEEVAGSCQHPEFCSVVHTAVSQIRCIVEKRDLFSSQL
jgi:hypothetical protein